MAVTQLDVLKIAVGMFAGAPSAKITKMLTEWKGDARSLFATVGESVYTKQVSDYKGLDAKAAAALLVQNLGGDTLTAEVKGWATAYVEKALANNKGNIGLVAYDAVNFLLTTEDANYAGVRKQLENRLAVAEKYVASTQGSEKSDFAILKSVTQDTATRDKAIELLGGVDYVNTIKLTTDKDELVALTNGNELITADVGTLQSGDIIIDAHSTDKDMLKAVITNINSEAAPTIRNIETIDVDFKGFNLSLDAKNIRDGVMKLSTSQDNNKKAAITGLDKQNTQNLTLDVDKSISELTLGGANAGAEANLVLNGQNITIDNSSINKAFIKGTGGASTVEFKAALAGGLEVSGGQNLTLKGIATTDALKNVVNKLDDGATLSVATQLSGATAVNLSKVGAANITLGAADGSVATTTEVTLANNTKLTLNAANALKGGTAAVLTAKDKAATLNVEVTNGAQDITTKAVGTTNVVVNKKGATFAGINVTTTSGNTDNITVAAAKDATVTLTSASKFINFNSQATANTTATINSSGEGATIKIDSASKATTLTSLSGKAKSTWEFSGDNKITITAANLEAQNLLNFEKTKGDVTITALTAATADKGVVVFGGAGKLTATGSASGDTFILGAGGGDITLGAVASTVDGSKATAAVKVKGDAGNDQIIGGAGNDTLDGGAGVNSLKGGAGKDTFVYRGASTNIEDLSAEDVVALVGTEAAANTYGTVKTANAAGMVAGFADSFGAAAAGKAHTELLQFGISATDKYTLHANTTGFVGSNNDDFVAGPSSAASGFSVRLGKGDDTLALSVGDGQAATIVFEGTAANNGKDTITGFKATEDKLDFSAFFGGDYTLMASGGGDSTTGTGTVDLTDIGAAALAAGTSIKDKITFVNAGVGSTAANQPMEQAILGAFNDDPAGSGHFKLGANEKGVVVLTTGTSNEVANVFYIHNQGDAKVEASDITLVGSITANAAWTTVTVNELGSVLTA